MEFFKKFDDLLHNSAVQNSELKINWKNKNNKTGLYNTHLIRKPSDSNINGVFLYNIMLANFHKYDCSYFGKKLHFHLI